MGEEQVPASKRVRIGEADGSVKFGEGFVDSEFLTFEFPEDVLNKLLQCDTSIAIRGEIGDSAVLCTHSDTYDVRLVETSNSCLLLQAESPSPVFVVEGKYDQHYELVRTAPKLARLRAILQESAYKGPDLEGVPASQQHLQESPEALDQPSAESHSMREGGFAEIGDAAPTTSPSRPPLYSFYELLDIVQSSEEELRQAVVSLHAVEIQGKVRLLDEEYMCEVLDMILTTCTEHGWQLDRVPVVAATEALSTMYPHFVVRGVLRMHSQENQHAALVCDKSAAADGEEALLDSRRVCVTRALTLFQATHSWPLDLFKESWKANCEPMEPSLDDLKGWAIQEEVQGQPRVSLLPTHTLPSDPQGRFASLFTRKPKWSQSEILPYVQEIAGPAQNAAALLLKYARLLQPTDCSEKVYCARATQDEMKKRKWRN